VVIGSAVLLVFVLLRPRGGLKRLFGIYPAIRAAFIGTAVAGLFAGFLDGVGFVVAGAAAATCVPLAGLAALRVLRHADDRTVAPPPWEQAQETVPVVFESLPLPEPVEPDEPRARNRTTRRIPTPSPASSPTRSPAGGAGPAAAAAYHRIGHLGPAAAPGPAGESTGHYGGDVLP